MKNKARAVFAILIGIILGFAINMSLIIIGSALIPAPERVNPQDVDSIAANIDLFGPQNFIFPFLAHAMGTLVGVVVAYGIASSQKRGIAWFMGGFFLLGGIYATTVIPAPTWYVIVDLVGAYLPMAWLGIIIMEKLGFSEAEQKALRDDAAEPEIEA